MEKTTEIKARDALFQKLLAIKTNRKKRSEYDEVFVEGIESIKQALTSKNVELLKLICIKGAPLSNWAINLIKENRFIEIVQVENELYVELSDKNEPSEIMITLRFHKYTLESLKLPDTSTVIISDRPSDQGNLGTLIRSANAFNINAIIIHGHAVDFLEPRVIRSSLGAVFHTPIVFVESFEDLKKWINEQKQTGMQVYGTDSTGNLSLDTCSFGKKSCLIIGNESKGMSQNLKTLVDNIIAIPMNGDVNSLNVSVAASIVMWSVYLKNYL